MASATCSRSEVFIKPVGQTEAVLLLALTYFSHSSNTHWQAFNALKASHDDRSEGDHGVCTQMMCKHDSVSAWQTVPCCYSGNQCLLACRQGGREDTQLEAQQLSVTLKTQNTLELTFTQAVVSCYQAAQGVLNDVALVAAEPTTLEDVILSDDGNLSPGGEALYWLQNLTDMPLQFWSSGPGQSKRTVPFAFEPSDLGELHLPAVVT